LGKRTIPARAGHPARAFPHIGTSESMKKLLTGITVTAAADFQANDISGYVDNSGPA
jgi:hypothetical protein